MERSAAMYAVMMLYAHLCCKGHTLPVWYGPPKSCSVSCPAEPNGLLLWTTGVEPKSWRASVSAGFQGVLSNSGSHDSH